MIQLLVQQSAGAAIGAFIGALIGLSISKKRKPDMKLWGDSVFLTASAAGGISLLVMMAINYLRMT